MRLAAEFGLEVGQLGSARAGSGRVASLGHEAGDDAVKLHVVVEAAVGEFGDALDVARREVRAKLDDDVAAGRKGKGPNEREARMSESEHIAAAPPVDSDAIDDEDRLRPEFVERVLDAVDAGD